MVEGFWDYFWGSERALKTALPLGEQWKLNKVLEISLLVLNFSKWQMRSSNHEKQVALNSLFEPEQQIFLSCNLSNLRRSTACLN